MIENSANPNASLRQYLFNPFRTVAGLKALLLGLGFITATSLIASVGGVHFDGVLDVHIYKPGPMGLFLTENLINWLCMVLFLFFSALIVSRSQWRFIDIAGTQALSRWPTLITALVMLPGANRRFGDYLMSKLGQGDTTTTVNSTDAVIFFIAAIIAVLMIIWMVALMYKAYTVSCNVKGAKAIVAFIISLLLAEVVSKILILALLSGTFGTKCVMGNLMSKSAQVTAVVGQFENDPELIGAWQSVDFVNDINDFKAGTKKWQSDLFLKELTFKENGITSKSCVWTKDWIYTGDGKAKAQYYIKPIDGEMYLFCPWLSGDVIIRGMKPAYYVLKRVTE